MTDDWTGYDDPRDDRGEVAREIAYADDADRDVERDDDEERTPAA